MTTIVSDEVLIASIRMISSMAKIVICVLRWGNVKVVCIHIIVMDESLLLIVTK